MGFGIAFEGCAGRAAFHVGVVEGLLETGLRPDFIAGASAGAIVAACVAADLADDLRAKWLAVAGSRVYRPELIRHGRWPWRMSEIVGGMLTQTFGELRLADLKYPAAIPVTVFERGRRRRRILTRADDVCVTDAVLGSCFVPGPYSTPVRIAGKLAWDGAWMVRTPVDAAFMLGARRVLAVVGHAEGRLKTGYLVERTVDLPAETRLVHPRSTLALGPYDTDPARMRAAIDIGRESMLSFAEAHRDWLIQAS